MAALPPLPPVPPLPTPRLARPATGFSLLQPLSRKGTGPGVIILVPDLSGDSDAELLRIEHGVPSVLMKWAEEGYTVVQVEETALEQAGARQVLRQALDIMARSEECEPKNVVGLVAYSPSLWDKVAETVAGIDDIKATVIYSDITTVLKPSSQPAIHHIAGKPKLADGLQRSEQLTQYDYPAIATTSSSFALPFQPSFNYRAEAISHTRNLTHLKKHMNGPYFDLEQIWDEHTYYEFENRSVEHTMATMVQEPYVNHVPTLTGGIGREALTNFYTEHFIFSNPADAELELVSRTVGVDRVVDEFIYKFSHVKQVNWILPGMPPTGIYLRVPMTAIVNIRGDRLYHEHIAWDQATVLKQLGIIQEYLPFPHAVSGSIGSKYECQVPVAGVEAAQKMVDKNSVVSNQMFGYKVREVNN